MSGRRRGFLKLFLVSLANQDISGLEYLDISVGARNLVVCLP